MSNLIEDTKNDLVEFGQDSINFLKKCSKPGKKGKFPSIIEKINFE